MTAVCALVGAIAAAAVALHDMAALAHEPRGWVLPLPGARDGLAVQATLLALCGAVGGGVIGALRASAYYRGPVVFAGIVNLIFACVMEQLEFRGRAYGSLTLSVGFAACIWGIILLDSFIHDVKDRRQAWSK